MSPYAVLGKEAKVRIHDNVEPNLAIHYRLAKDGSSDFILGGLPESAFTALPILLVEVHRFLDAFEGYVLVEAAVRCLAFIGLFGFLVRAFKCEEELACLVAAGFSWLPWFPIFGLAASGIPLLAFAAIVLIQPSRGRLQRVLMLVVMALFPLCSSVTWTPFMFAVMAAFALGVWLYSRRFPAWLASGLGLFAGVSAVVNWPLVEASFGSEAIEWHRAEYLPAPLDIASILKQSAFSQYHAEASPRPFVWAAVLMASIMAVNATLGTLKRLPLIAALLFVALALFLAPDLVRRHSLVYVLCIVAAISLRTRQPPRSWLISLGSTGATIGFVATVWIAYDAQLLNWLPAGENFQYRRWYIFLPFVLYAMFFASLSYLASTGKSARLIAFGLAFCQMGMLFAERWETQSDDWIMTYSQYESRVTFDRVDELIVIPREDYQIACIGFYPSVAHLNGFNTVGGYWALYPLKWKHQMRSVIAGELEKSPALREYFDNWGNRCYVWASSCRPHDVRLAGDPPATFQDLAIDTNALSEMGADYVLSSLKIDNSAEIGLEYLGTIPSADPGKVLSLWVYEIDSGAASRRDLKTTPKLRGNE
ncbi:hypothetical protein LzC2_30430 [Planctomycetes bacterium LzC2]|uniref:Transmembrane protein n=2 Tax=Alienimonas chondri TaxID=2681879 RepID=A0ABX1VGI7_9PLAN|nr:hypothetical protein [Alienimonas chondri]